MTPRVRNGQRLSHHPAVIAALESGLSRPEPEAIETLLDSDKSAVYRLHWSDPHLASLIVKRSAEGPGDIEHRMYEDVLPQLPIRTPRCFGAWRTREGTVWLTLEDVGDEVPSLHSSRCREALTRLAATLHEAWARTTELDELPERGHKYYARRLGEARALLEARSSSDRLDDDDREILAAGMRRCDLLASKWPHIEAVCDRFPHTLTHGDLVEENLRVVRKRGEPELVLIDWEKAGRGPPAVDMVRVSPDLYRHLTQRTLATPRREIDELVLIGRIFRVLVHRWASKPVTKVERAEARLDKLMHALDGRASE